MSNSEALRWAQRRVRELEDRANTLEKDMWALRALVETQRREVEEKSQGFDRMVLLEDVTVGLAERIEALEDKLSGG